MEEITNKSPRIDKAIATAQYIMRKKKRRIDEMSQRFDLNENQKIFIGQETELIQVVDLLIKESKNYINAQLGKIPPQAIEIEATVLGALLSDQTALPKISGFLKADHFYSDNHKEIFAAINDLNNSNEPVDLKTVAFKLRQRHSLERIGAWYLTELFSHTYSSGNIEFHARLMIELAIKRQLIKVCSEIIYESYDEASDCFEILERTENYFKEINSWKEK